MYMKQNIRFNTFETNSSSTHNIVIIPDSKIEAWYNNELYYARYTWDKKVKEFIEKNNGRELYTKQELIDAGFFDDMPKREDFECEFDYEYMLEEYLSDNDFVTYENWSRDLEEDSTIYTTENGEKIHIICQFGYEG